MVWSLSLYPLSLTSAPPRYTAVKGFAKTVLETNDLAGQRELVAEYIEAEVRWRQELVTVAMQYGERWC